MTKRAATLAGFLALVPLVGRAQDTPAPVELKEGDLAPAFSLPGSDGKTHSNADYKGRTIVLAWFPKAFTGG